MMTDMLFMYVGVLAGVLVVVSSCDRAVRRVVRAPVYNEIEIHWQIAASRSIMVAGRRSTC